MASRSRVSGRIGASAALPQQQRHDGSSADDDAGQARLQAEGAACDPLRLAMEDRLKEALRVRGAADAEAEDVPLREVPADVHADGQREALRLQVAEAQE